MASRPTGPDASAGSLSSPVGDVEVFLRDAQDRDIRVAWSKDQAGEERRLVPGTYGVRGYRIRRVDEHGIPWHISISSPGAYRRLEVGPGMAQSLELDDRIRLSLGVHHQRGRRRLQLAVVGDRRQGLTLYRDGRRVELEYRLLGPRGQVLAKAPLEYG